MAWHGMAAADTETNTNHLFNNHLWYFFFKHHQCLFFLISQFCHVAEVVIDDRP
jgi:hypothetical protein